MNNKYSARRTYSNLCGRWFASKKECIRGEELALLVIGKQIADLEYQPKFVLCDDPKITYTADFRYWEVGIGWVVEDSKGVLTRDTRTKLAWVKEKYNIEVKLT